MALVFQHMFEVRLGYEASIALLKGLDGIVSLTFHEAFTGEFVERDSDVRVHKAGEFVGVPSNTGLKRRGGNKRMNMSYMNMVEAMSDPACVHI
ncbi:hypothetical protein D0Y65_040827 [Glycine soja]|uniref:Uncharacterized protein n=1 Tax=Glycine soja TaxID=3848 RepID=A0A445GT54_GLYSO|nr:hypothetical protein D0Y65_040827 [Glycine soja]